MAQRSEITKHGTGEAPFVEHRIARGVVRVSPTARYALSEPSTGESPVKVVIDRGLLWAAVDGGDSGQPLEVRHREVTMCISSGRMMLDAGSDGDTLVVVVEGSVDVSTGAGGRHHLPASAAAELTAAGTLTDVAGITWAELLSDPWANANLQRDTPAMTGSTARPDRSPTLADALSTDPVSVAGHTGATFSDGASTEPEQPDPPPWDDGRLWAAEPDEPPMPEHTFDHAGPGVDAPWSASFPSDTAPSEADPHQGADLDADHGPVSSHGDARHMAELTFEPGEAQWPVAAGPATPDLPGNVDEPPANGRLRRGLFVGLVLVLSVLAVIGVALALRQRSNNGAWRPASPATAAAAPVGQRAAIVWR